jgi:TonB family protein
MLLSTGLWVRAEGTDTIQLEISVERTINVRDGTRGVNAYLAPVGPFESRVRAGRVTLSHALDDTGTLLTQVTTNKFYSVSVGKIDDSKDFTSRGPAPFSLWGLSKDAKALEMLSGTLELVIPDLDPGSTVAAENIASLYGFPIASDALARAGVTLVVFDKKSAYAAAAAKVHGGPQDYDAGILFGQSQFARPPGFPKIEMQEGDFAVAIDDPQERLVGVEFQSANGSPLRYNHGGNYHSSGFDGSPGRRFDTYHVGTSLPGNLRLVCWLITPKSVLKVPFHIDMLPLPDENGGRRNLGLIIVQVGEAAVTTKEMLDYQETQGNSTAESTAPQVADKVMKLWSDVPEYTGILKKDMHYKMLPRLISSVAPEQPAGPPLPPNMSVKVLVSFVVDDKGAVEAARVIESNDARYNIPAVEAVLAWKFQPAEVEDGPAMAFVTIPFVFQARGPAQPPPG